MCTCPHVLSVPIHDGLLGVIQNFGFDERFLSALIRNVPRELLDRRRGTLRF